MSSSHDDKRLKIGKSILYDPRPESIGPGWWSSLHTLAYVCDTSKIKDARELFVENVVRGIAQHFPCLHCRAHAVAYINQEDPISHLTSSISAGAKRTCLEWTHRFHTAVNKRLNKKASENPTLEELEQFLEALREGRGCNDCGTIGDEQKPTLQLSFMRRQLVD